MQDGVPHDWADTVKQADALRIAFLPDSFHEVNGVAHTARNFAAFALRETLPLLCIRAAPPGTRGTAVYGQEGSVETLDLPRSRAAIHMERDLSFDPLFFRHARRVERTLRSFRPDVIHITGPSELGILGAWFAWRLGIPLAAGWHTNLHEYAARRIGWLQRLWSGAPRLIEAGTLAATTRFYRLARIIFAPNGELCDLLQRRTGRSCHVMRRGVDTQLFTPARRTRPVGDRELVIGYVGRLSVEKNVMLLPVVADAVQKAGLGAVRFVIVGQGEGEQALRRAMPVASFPGVLRGADLARAYADMDLFLFPSETDTFGNVVLEALASGVPAAVTTGGGPKFIVANGMTGVVCAAGELAGAVVRLIRDQSRLRAMGIAARTYALTCQWDTIFNDVYAGYRPLERTTRR